MKKEAFLAEMAKSLESDKLTPETTLDAISWDSLSVMVFIALVDRTFQVSLTPTDVKDCQTVQDLLNVTKVQFE